MGNFRAFCRVKDPKKWFSTHFGQILLLFHGGFSNNIGLSVADWLFAQKASKEVQNSLFY